MRRIAFGVLALGLWIGWTAGLPAQAEKDDPSAQEAVLKTDAGDIVVRLFGAEAPLHAAHFRQRAREGYYDGTTFHRVFRNAAIFGGDPKTKNPEEKDAYGQGGLDELKFEACARKCLAGAVVATTRPGEPDSGGSQFFICLAPQPQMDGAFTVFGEVVAGMAVARKISETPTGEGNLAAERVVLKKVELRPPTRPPFEKAGVAEMKRRQAVIATPFGDITVAFFPEKAPEHVRAFLNYAAAGLYDDCDFHRVAPGFCLQGGLLYRRTTAPDEIALSWVHPLKAEFNDTVHDKGIVSMARTDDPDSALTSFFVCLGPAPHLDGKYTAFGRVVAGLDVVDRIAALPCDGETPRERVPITSIRLKTVE